jgi:hypothetical protein
LPPTNAWTHVAVSRSGTSARLFINGALVATATDSTNFAQTQVVIANTSVAGTEEYSGYISNLRFIKGTAVYTAAFTPQTSPLTAVTNTQLLTCQSNRFVDNSTNAFSLSVGGTPSVQAFGPFAPALQWTPDVVGGSGYYDGTTDWLQTPSSSAFSITGDFTYEGWVYVTSTSTGRYIMPSSVSMNLDVIQASGNNMQLRFFDGSSTFLDAINTFPINTWAHVAIVRSGTSTNNCSFYVNGVRGTQFTTNATNSSPFIEIGRFSLGGYFYGYIGTLRIVNGQAVYSGATYTVPNAPLTTTGYGTTSQSITASNTKLLLNMTNAGIYDGAMDNVLETVGNAQVATNPVKYGSGSMYFDGTGDYLLLQAGPNLALGSGDFTIEMWFYVTTTAAVQALMDFRPTSTDGAYPLIYISSGGGSIILDVSAGTRITGTTTISTNTWYHFALARSGTSTKMFVNGTQVGSTYTDTNNYLVGTNRPAIASNGFTLGNNPLTGYIDDLRITKGVCRYFTTFTPPQQALPRQ